MLDESINYDIILELHLLSLHTKKVLVVVYEKFPVLQYCILKNLNKTNGFVWLNIILVVSTYITIRI